MTVQGDVTQILVDASQGNEEAVARIWDVVYEELRAIAHRQLLRERSDHTLSTTALVHEAYLRLIDQTRVEWQDRAHFFGVSAQAMRRILVDYARKHRAQKRGGGIKNLSLDKVSIPVDESIEDLLTLDAALEKLAALNERLCKVVELRYFGGLTEDETAEALGVTTRTVQRDWAKARAWLRMEIYGGTGVSSPDPE